MIKNFFKKLKTIFIPCQENKYRPKLLDSNFLFYYLIFILLLRLFTFPIFIYFPHSSFFASLTKDDLIELTNQDRRALGLEPVKEDPLLSQAAVLKAQDMIALDYFGHYSPQGKSPWYWFDQVGYKYQKAGENLAIGFVDSEEVFQAWKNSPSHWQNIVNPSYRDIGIAVVRGNFQGQDVTLVVQLFGSKMESSSQRQEVQAKEINNEYMQEESSSNKIVNEEKGNEIIKNETNPAEISQNTPEEPSGQSIIGQEISSAQTIAQAPSKNQGENWQVKILKFFALNYTNLVQKIIFFSLIFIVIALFLTIFINIRSQPKDLLYKAIFSIIIFMILLFLDKGVLIQLIPHNLMIG